MSIYHHFLPATNIINDNYFKAQLLHLTDNYSPPLLPPPPPHNPTSHNNNNSSNNSSLLLHHHHHHPQKPSSSSSSPLLPNSPPAAPPPHHYSPLLSSPSFSFSSLLPQPEEGKRRRRNKSSSKREEGADDKNKKEINNDDDEEKDDDYDEGDFSQQAFYQNQFSDFKEFLKESQYAPVVFVIDFDHTLAVCDDLYVLEESLSNSLPSVYTRPFMFQLLNYLKAVNVNNILILWTTGTDLYIKQNLLLLNIAQYFNHVLSRNDTELSRQKFDDKPKSHKYLVHKFPQYKNMRSVLIDNLAWHSGAYTGYSEILSVKPYCLVDVMSSFGAFNISPDDITDVITFLYSKGKKGVVKHNHPNRNSPIFPYGGDSTLLNVILYLDGRFFNALGCSPPPPSSSSSFSRRQPSSSSLSAAAAGSLSYQTIFSSFSPSSSSLFWVENYIIDVFKCNYCQSNNTNNKKNNNSGCNCVLYFKKTYNDNMDQTNRVLFMYNIKRV